MPRTVAVTIPVYNQVPERLDRAVRSAVAAGANQVIVVDDGSDTPVENIWGGVVEVKRLHQNFGVAVAVNRALVRVRCDYVCRSASDDEFDPGKIRRQLEWMQERGVDASFHDVRDSRTGERYETGLPRERCMPHRNRARWRARLRTANRFYGGASMIRWSGSLARYRHPEHLRYSQDWYWNLWVEHAVGWHHLPEVLGTIGRYDDGLEARSHTDPEARRNWAWVAARAQVPTFTRVYLPPEEQ